MIETILLDLIKASENLEADIYMEEPATKPTSFYVMEKTGSREENKIYEATIAIQSIASSMYEAASLNESIKSIMLDEVIASSSISRVELNSDYNFTDATTKRYRYQAVFTIVY